MAEDYRAADLFAKMGGAEFLAETEGIDVGAEPLVGYYRALCFWLGRGVEPDRERAREILASCRAAFVAAGEGGDARVQNALGVCHEFGMGFERDFARARDWFRRSASGGCGKGQYNYARYLMEGIGGEIKQGEAVRWYRIAAEHGDPSAQFDYACLLARGTLVPMDGPCAARMLLAAAAGGNSRAGRIRAAAGSDAWRDIWAELLIVLALDELAAQPEPQLPDGGDLAYSFGVPEVPSPSVDDLLWDVLPEGAEIPAASGRRWRRIPDLNRANPSFAALLLKHVRDRFDSDAPRVYHAAGVSRKTYSAIVGNELRPVSKRTAVAFAFALELSHSEAETLLRAAGYALSESILEDIVFSACLKAGIHDLARVNAVLARHGAEALSDAGEG